jgi:ubiquitin-conjugating enzyme E2 G2
MIQKNDFFNADNCLYYRGPEGTCFEGGVFPARLTFPADYPLGPPKMKFTCELFHPNSK